MTSSGVSYAVAHILLFLEKCKECCVGILDLFCLCLFSLFTISYLVLSLHNEVLARFQLSVSFLSISVPTCRQLALEIEELLLLVPFLSFWFNGPACLCHSFSLWTVHTWTHTHKPGCWDWIPPFNSNNLTRLNRKKGCLSLDPIICPSSPRCSIMGER